MALTLVHRPRRLRSLRPPCSPTPSRSTTPMPRASTSAKPSTGCAVPPDRAPQPVRRFGTFTADLDALADWRIDCGVTTVAMESTGVYWIPFFELLEARGVPGPPDRSPSSQARPRTTANRSARLPSGCNACTPTGLLAAAFRPADQVCVLRSYLRHRQMLLTYWRAPYSAYAQGPATDESQTLPGRE